MKASSIYSQDKLNQLKSSAGNAYEKTNQTNALATKIAESSKARRNLALQQKVDQALEPQKGKPMMLKRAGKDIKRPHTAVDWARLWPRILNREGQEANPYGPRANQSLARFGIPGIPEMMSAHLIPKRIGGQGNRDNVVPWPINFENGIWEYAMERPFNDRVADMIIGDELGYAVLTEDLGAAKATDFVDRNAPGDMSAADKVTAIERIKDIPKKVIGYIDGVQAVNHTFADNWWDSDRQDYQ